MLENIDRIIEFVTTIATVLFVICRSNSNIKRKIDEHLTPNGGNSIKDHLTRIEQKIDSVDATQKALLDLQEESTGHFLSTAKGDLFWVSDIFCELMDLERKECLGATWFKGVSNQDQATVYQHWNLKLDTRGIADIHFTTRSGRQLKLKAVPIIDSKNNLLGFVGNVKNLDH